MGAVKRKSVRQALAEARAEDSRPLRWIPVPAWTTEANVAYLWAGNEPERMSKVTKAEYRAALAQHLPDVVEAGQVEDSWKTFLDGIHERGGCRRSRP